MTLPRTGFIDHIGIGVPDLAAAKRYYDELMSILGLREWFETGLHHLAFLVASRAVVREAHEWAQARDAVVLDEPGEFPQYGPDCFATYWLDPHGIKLEAVCHSPEES